ncbi:putative NAD(P)H dehydrogenase (quinone) [Lupinus albus]|uniref:Putative NAD(P)H dehydrogenase (Quinone) n=1 Tax=Lupinus albus TaxID=3870 RepID=A0A6A4QWW4_LUPAL|nr:putative NAD(P)H dehydrogenase (quinone) [Lupinus albus]
MYANKINKGKNLNGRISVLSNTFFPNSSLLNWRGDVPETLPNEVLGKMSAPPKSDGFVFGFPTRFGMMSAQFKAFLDATGGLWRTQQYGA